MDAIIDNYELIAISFGYTFAVRPLGRIGSLLLGALLVTLRVGPVAVMRRRRPPTSPWFATPRC